MVMNTRRAKSGSDPESDWYRIRIQGHLDPRWSSWFGALALTHDTDGTTLLRGHVTDQAALHGLLTKVRDMGLPLISVTSQCRSFRNVTVTRIARNTVQPTWSDSSHNSPHGGSPMSPTEEPKVRLVLLDGDVLELLVRGNYEAAGRDLHYPIPAAFAEDAWLWRLRLEDLRAAPESHEWLVRAIVSPGRGIVGHAGFHGPPNASGEATVSYSVIPSERGRGFAKAALRELLGLAANGGARAAVATISPGNSASLAVIQAFDFEPRGDQRDDDDEVELIFVCPLPAKHPGHP